MNDQKIAFIVAVNKAAEFEEYLAHIQQLQVPQGFEIELFSVEGEDNIAKAYNEIMACSDAKYKIYMQQDVQILNENILVDVLEVFQNQKIGMLGILGSDDIKDHLETKTWTNGGFIDSANENSRISLGKVVRDYREVQALSKLLFATQYDLRWREDLFKETDCYLPAQVMEYIKEGYLVAVPRNAEKWVLFDSQKDIKGCYGEEISVFLKEYAETINILTDTKEEIIKVSLGNTEISKNQRNLYSARTEFLKMFPEAADVTISVLAYNRLDVTKRCVESLLRNTKGINYKLLLVYNDNEEGKGTLEYYKSVKYKNKLIIHMEKNAGVGPASKEMMKHIEGKYYIGLANDIIVTPNWLHNLITCAESDERIGMITPVSSNTSNLQGVNLDFSNYEEMQDAAKRFNVSDPRKWEERLRLITIGTLMKRECMEAIGVPFDIGFFHDFSDDEVSFRVRRAGYKCVLAGDTWVHHNHDFSKRDPVKLQESLNAGRKNFQEKYFGLESWRDTCNFHMEYIQALKCCETKAPKLLGVDVKCGTPLLQMKNKLRTYDVFDSELYAYTRKPEYYLDLQTVCGCQNVTCGEENTLLSHYAGQKFDYIIIGDCINQYSNPMQFLKDVSQLLADNGQLFLSLKNGLTVLSILQLVGEAATQEKDLCINYTKDYFVKEVTKLGLNIRYILSFIHDDINAMQKQEVENLISRFAGISNISEKELMARLVSDRHAFVITKRATQ